jgi:hypothetical protein
MVNDKLEIMLKEAVVVYFKDYPSRLETLRRSMENLSVESRLPSGILSGTNSMELSPS